MGGTFACPECGLELAVAGVTPGREVLCPECSTLVEVPYLPRAAGWKKRRGGRGRRASPWLDSKLLRGAVAFAAITLIGLAASRMVGGRVRSGRERVLAELIASADSAEASGTHAAALYQIEAALVQARTMEPASSARLAELLFRRDRASAREVRGRLDAVDALDPDRAVGESLTLAERARGDRALKSLAGEIGAKLEASRLRQARADLEIARRSLDAADGPGAFAAAERLHDRAGHLADPDALRYQAEAEAVIDAAVARLGVALAVPAGPPESPLARPLVEALAARGYLLPPRRATWRKLWDEHAPFLASARLVEVQEELYLQSKNRITQAEGFLELAHRGKTAWHGHVAARTREPLPDLTGYIAGHLATAGRRDPEIERRFRADAHTLLAEQAAKVLRGLPRREDLERVP